MLAANRQRAVVEIVDQLFDTHGICRGHPSGVEQAADIGIRRGVDIQPEGGERRDPRIVEAMFGDGLVPLAIEGLAGPRRHGGNGRCSHESLSLQLALLLDGLIGSAGLPQFGLRVGIGRCCLGGLQGGCGHRLRLRRRFGRAGREAGDHRRAKPELKTGETGHGQVLVC